MLMNLGGVAMATGELPESKGRVTEGLQIAKQNDNRLPDWRRSHAAGRTRAAMRAG